MTPGLAPQCAFTAQRVVARCSLAALLCVFSSAFLSPPVYSKAEPVRIDSRVLEDTSLDQEANFLVLLRAQADLRAARYLARADRGQYVYNLLRQSANSTQPSIRSALDSQRAKYRAFWAANLFAVRGNRALVDILAARSDVLAIESDRPFRVPLESPGRGTRAVSAIEWNVNQVNSPAMWALGFDGHGGVYANADTGVQWDHPALKSHYRGWNGTSVDHNYNWWDAIHSDWSGNSTNPCNPEGFIDLPNSGSLTPCDDDGHGTHTMGIGIGDDGLGHQIGVAPGAKWISCRNMDEGVGRPSTYIECLQFFLAPTDLEGNNPDPGKRPDAVGNSYGCPPSELCAPASLHTIMDNMRAAGIFMSVSAGNYGPSCSTIDDPPGLEDSAITVAATDHNDHVAGFSSRGPVTIDGSGRRKPDLSAPGVGVTSSYPSNTYTTLSGTSMAAPHVAGAAVILWSAIPSLRGNVDRTEVLLEQGALHLTSDQACGSDSAIQVPNNAYGFGRIDVLAAYNWWRIQTQPIQIYFPSILKGN